MRWQPEFWLHHRPIKTSHAETRPRHTSQSMRVLKPSVTSGVEFEVRNFQLYGGLRRTRTEVKNTLPTAMTIKTEKTLLSFDEQKKKNQYNMDYSDLYRCLSASVVPSTVTVPGKVVNVSDDHKGDKSCLGPATSGKSKDPAINQ